MASIERFKDMGYQRTVRTDSSHTDWQTPLVSGKSVSRFAGAPGIKAISHVPVGHPCPKNTEEFCSANGSTSFQPIRSQVTIPTAHVMPSTLGMSSTNTYDHVGAQNSTDPAVCGIPVLPSADEPRKFETPNIEPTLNQSGLLHAFYNDPRPSASAGGIRTETEPYRTLPESKVGNSGDHIRSVGDHSHSQGWRPETYIHPAAELCAWRQQQTENMRLRMEQLQLGRGCPTLPVYPDNSELGRVLKASEGVLLEKEYLVERQRQHISQLEQKLRESEVQVHSTLLNQPNPYSDMYMIRLQELQREVTFLRAQFAEKNDSSNREKADLERKLAACEAECKSFQEQTKQTAHKHAEELKKQEERIKGRDRHINSLKKKCQKEAEQNKEKQQRIETLERYLADLPTVKDHQKQTHELNNLKEKSCLLQDQVKELETKLRETRSLCRERESQLVAEEQKGQELLSTIDSLQKEVERFNGTGQRDEEKRLTQMVEVLQQEVLTLQKERECLKNVVGSQTKKTEQLCSRLKELEEQVTQEEGTGQALKEETQRKENALQQLKEAVKELAVQNQDLMERNVYLQEQLHHAGVSEKLSSDDSTFIITLHKELNICLKDLKSICCLLNQRMQGMDPNLSMLLGINSAPVSEDHDILNSTSLERHLNGVRQLKQDIDDLRTTISDRYAQDMGDNCVTQ
ncbi:centrosomal protein of 85 kDa [Spea bombifrons]|uniref:centrosomal protein of 85 kDa n=1 Tax=Spea bombifrons TaxID=233779 RepID=UPI00234B0115|nr:centrosomal protein of 85 kDa [Spea bombifrons]XP_053310479.1 centrosomal protein of 85 kDa [Spea bombifrons]